FFQAEDGIRDGHVTGVQTCALPILILAVAGLVRSVSYYYEDYLLSSAAQEIVYGVRSRLYRHLHRLPLSFHQSRRTGDLLVRLRSEERRVGKGCWAGCVPHTGST